MSKPEDIPQHVWDAAVAISNKADAWAKIGPALSPTTVIARAIQTAKAEAYDEAAQTAYEAGQELGQRAIAHFIASAIRKLGSE